MNKYKAAVISLMRYKTFVMKFVLLYHVNKEHGNDIKSVLVLQNCVGLIKDEPDSGSEARVTALDVATKEDNIKVEGADVKVEVSNIKFEESIDIKEENPEAITVPTIKSEPEVSVCVCGLCEAATVHVS